MRPLTLRLAIGALGAYAQIAQALLVRELLVVFYGNEIGLGAFFGTWLAWVALGSLAAARWFGRLRARNPLPLLRALVLALPLLLGLQMAAARAVRLALDVSAAAFVPLGQMLAATALITLPTGLAIGLVFPLACRALELATGTRDRAVGQVSGLYVLDALGSLAGGLLFTFVLLEWAGPWRSLGWLAATLAGVVWSLGAGRATRAAATGLALVGLLLALTPLGAAVQRGMEELRFRTLQPSMRLTEALETRYGHVAVATLGAQTTLVTDGRVAASFPDPHEDEQAAAYYYAQAAGARRVLALGGLAGGLVPELLRYPLERLEVVEQDALAFARVRPHLPPDAVQALQDPRLVVHFEDGRRFVGGAGAAGPYDLVLVLAGDPSTAQANRYYTRELYLGLRRLMAPDGVLCTGVGSASNYLGREVQGYGASVLRTLFSVLPQMALMPGDVHTYCASAAPDRVSEDPGELARRYLATPLAEHRFPAESFHSLLRPQEVRYARDRLTERPGELNTDARPVTYYLNMLLWGKFSASGFVDWLERLRRMGPWPYLVPLAVLAVLLPVGAAGRERAGRERQAAVLALAVLGFVAMAAQLALVLSYQAQVGHAFGRIALLNAVFMAGLALGAGALGGGRIRRAGLALAAVLALVAGALLALPPALDALARAAGQAREPAYLLLCAGAGLLTGAGFPLGLRQTRSDQVVVTSGLTQAADNLGGAVGGLLTGALLVPLLGVDGTCRLLAAAAGLAALPVLLAPLPAPPFLRERAHRAFPHPRLSAALVFLVLCAGVLQWLGRGGEPPPQLHFAEARLAQVSGSRAFTLAEQPMPHYLGQDLPQAGAAPDTVTLASIGVAAQVRGYGGPLNLLVAVDGRGRLRGARHVQSAETPAYIAGIDEWLGGLAGQDLAAGPLDLQRVDGLSGATVTSRAALECINRAARAGSALAFGQATPPAAPAPDPLERLSSPRFLLTLALVLAFFPVYLSGREGLRLAYQVAALAVLGLGLNALLTEVDLAHLSRGGLPSPADNPQWYLLAGFGLLTALLFGQAYCGYVCPFGALQELLSRAGRWLRLRSYPGRGLETRMRQLKFVLLALMLLAFWATGDAGWVGFNPMQHLFGGKLQGWVLAIAGVSLAGALFYYRFWCRYFCPFGAFLALSNRLALARRLAPRRRFSHCDLGVTHEYDVDCIHCHRCLTGRDFGVRRRPDLRAGSGAGAGQPGPETGQVR
jgi:spermidine synthase